MLPAVKAAGGGKPKVIYSGVGTSLDLALQQASFSISRDLFLSHTELFILGEELGRHGLTHVFDFIIRNPQVRVDTNILMVKGMAQKALTVPEQLEKTIGEEVLGLIRQAKESSEADPQKTFQILRQMATPGQDAHTTVLDIGPPLMAEGQPQEGQAGGEGGGGGEESGSQEILSLGGLAVFNGEKLAGFLDHIETRGFLWLTGEVQEGIIAIHDPENPDKTVSLLVARMSTKITPVVEGDTVSFRVEVEEEGDILSQESTADLTTEEMLAKLNSAKAGAIKQEIEKALQKLQELESDIVGFGTILNRKDPKTFNKFADRWPQVFRELNVEVHVISQIRRTGQHSYPTRAKR
jgi:spore germination protein KC